MWNCVLSTFLFRIRAKERRPLFCTRRNAGTAAAASTIVHVPERSGSTGRCRLNRAGRTGRAEKSVSCHSSPPRIFTGLLLRGRNQACMLKLRLFGCLDILSDMSALPVRRAPYTPYCRNTASCCGSREYVIYARVPSGFRRLHHSSRIFDSPNSRFVVSYAAPILTSRLPLARYGAI